MFNSYFIIKSLGQTLATLSLSLLSYHRDMLANPVTLSFGAEQSGLLKASHLLLPPGLVPFPVLFIFCSFHEENASIIQHLWTCNPDGSVYGSGFF